MIQAEVTIDGVGPALARLRHLEADVLGIIEPPLLRFGHRVEDRNKTYPPKPANSTYDRTMKLGQAWFTDPVVRSGDQARLNMGNKMIYAPFVKHEGSQAWMHRNVWETDETAMNEEMPQAVEEMRAALVAAAGGE